MYGMLIIRIKTFGFVPTNDKTTNRPPSIPVKPWCPQVTGPRHHDRQTTDRQTNLLYVCMYVLTFSLCTSVVSLLLILFFFGVEGTSLPRHPTYQHPLHYFQTFGIRSFSDYQNVFKRFQITGLLSAWTFSDIWISTFLRSVKVYPFSPQAVGALRGLPKEVVCLFGGSPLGTKATTTHLQR